MVLEQWETMWSSREGSSRSDITMNLAEFLLLSASCYIGSSAPHPHAPQRPEQNKLKYLFEPPVYAEVIGRRGENVTLPCILQAKPAHYKVKWTKLEPERPGPENIVLISDGRAFKRYGRLGPRASLRQAHAMDASLRLHRLQLGDGGTYRCELINGIEDESVAIALRIEGVVFPYQGKNGHYQLTFQEAQEACDEQDGMLATLKQLYRAWSEGLDWCNAGWLSDGTVRYPILNPRAECGGELLPPGIRSYGPKNKDRDRFDAFCFTSAASGSVFYVAGLFSYGQAAQACDGKGAELALVGQLYSSWRFHVYDRCDGGWLRDGSVRYPISTPRRRCGGMPEPGVRSFGFPDKTQRLYGAYCYR